MPCLRRDWLKGGSDFFAHSTSRIGDTSILSAYDRFFLPFRGAGLLTEAPGCSDWGKAAAGVVFISSAVHQTSQEGLPCRSR